MYQLDEATRQRHGRVHLYKLQQTESDVARDPQATYAQHENAVEGCANIGASSDAQQQHAAKNGAYSLNLQHYIDIPGVFDLKWCPSNQWSTGCLGAALADGTLRLYTVADTEADGARQQQQLQLQQVASCQAITQGSSMCLSLDWCTSSSPSSSGSSSGGSSSSGCHIAVSGSGGSAAVVQATPTGLHVAAEWEAHELEVWCAAFSRVQPDVLYTGSDDCAFKAWDIRGPMRPQRPALAAAAGGGSSCGVPGVSNDAHDDEGDNGGDNEDDHGSDDPPPCCYTNRKAHSAGVCTLSPHPFDQHIIASGSYDERVRLWDTRMPTRPLLTAEVSTGGGNWRLRWHPSDPTLLLAACMYNGFALLRCDGGYGRLEVVETFNKHGSIAYGADWHQGTLQRRRQAAAATDDAAAAGGIGSGSSASDCGEGAGGAGSGAAATSAGQGSSGGGGSGRGLLVATASFYDRLLYLWSPGQVLAQA